jgi:hypothetical protein
VLRDAAAGNAAGPYEGYTKTRGVVVALSLRIASSTLTLGTTINARRCAQCACPRVDPFLTCFGRYLVNVSNRFVRRWRVIADVTLVRSNFYSLFLRTSMHHLKVGQEDGVGT